MRGGIGCLVLIAILAIAARVARDYIRRHPQDVPWTALRLSDPVGRFTVSKLVSLRDRPDECRAMLDRAGSGDVPVPHREEGANCGYRGALRLQPAGQDDVAFRPVAPVASCPLAAAMFLLEKRVIRAAAVRHFGSEVVAIDHAGTYSCRRTYGRDEGRFSEHATANAFDLAGFRLADGTGVSILRDWNDGGAKGAFLHDVRDGACRLFSTVLSPDYNAAHADHLHLDMAGRGRFGGSLCR